MEEVRGNDMVINKYSSSIADVRLRNSLDEYPSKDEVDEKVNRLRTDTFISIRLLEDKVNENEKDTKTVIQQLLLYIKILTVTLLIVILFGIIFVISYLNLKSDMNEALSSSIENTWTIEEIM